MTHATSRRGLTNVLEPKTTDTKSPAKPENKSGGWRHCGYPRGPCTPAPVILASLARKTTPIWLLAESRAPEPAPPAACHDITNAPVPNRQAQKANASHPKAHWDSICREAPDAPIGSQTRRPEKSWHGGVNHYDKVNGKSCH